MAQESAPNCWKCRHFVITHQPRFPYQCEALGFKTRNLPCNDVIAVDGRPCQRFAPKAYRQS